MTSHSSGPVLMDVEERGSSRKEIGGSTQEEVPEPGGDGGGVGKERASPEQVRPILVMPVGK